MLPSRRVVPLRSKKSMEQYLWRTKESLDFAWAMRAAAAAAPQARFVLYMEARGPHARPPRAMPPACGAVPISKLSRQRSQRREL